MPRKSAKGSAQVIVVPASEQEPEEVKPTEQVEMEEAVERATGELPTRAQARLYRAHPATGNRDAFVDSIDADMFSQDYVKENYGGGRYRVQFFGRKGDGKIGFVKQERFEIDLSIPPKVPGFTPPGQAPAPAAQGTSALDTAVVGMLTTMMTQIASQAQTSAAAQASLMNMQMTMMKDHSSAMQAQLAKLSERPPERDTLGEMTKIVTMMKDLNPPGPTRSLKEELETLGLLKEFMGEGPNETSWLDVIKEVAPTLIQAGAKRDGIPTARVRPTLRKGEVQVPAIAGSGTDGSGGSEAGATPTAETPNVNANLRFVAPIMPRVIKWAAQGKNAELCADWLLSDIPAGFYPMLREQLMSPTFMDDIVQAFPAADPFRPWIGTLRDSLVEQMEPEHEPDEEGDDEEE